MKTRRIFAAVLAVMMLLSVVPMTAFGITTNDVDTKGTTTGPYDDSELYLGKTATLEDDGTYTIRLEAFATGNPVTTQLRSGLPLDIVLVLDQSGSMYNNDYLETLRQSVDEFIDVIAANGRSIGVTHRVAIVGYASNATDGPSDYLNLAGGSASYYVNTGVFLEDGTFKNYGDAKTDQYVVAQGELNPNGTYYIKSGNSYRQLTATASYTAVSNPSTDRTDLYALVNGSYLPALYADNEYYEVTNLDASKTYYIDVDGVKTPITSSEEETEGFVAASSIATSAGTNYWIDTDSDGTPETELEYSRSSSSMFGGTTYYYKDSNDNEYSRYSSTQFRRNSRNYTAYVKGTVNVTVWKTASDTVVDTAAETVYDLLSGWVYLQNGAFYSYTGTLYEVSGITWKYGNTTYDPESVIFYEKGTAGGLTTEDYRDALMPVTDGEAGAGSITEALEIAVSKIAASGGTRTSLGMEMAKKVLDNREVLENQDERQSVVIVFTDGEPGKSGFAESEANAALEVSAQLKAEDGSYNATVYTIGLYESTNSTNVTKFMHGLSSNYPNVTELDDVPDNPTGKHYMYASDKEELYDIFPEIVTDSTTTTLDQKWLTADTLIRDIMQKGFVLTNGTTITMSSLAGTSSDHMITWADNETVIDTLTITDATAEVTTSKHLSAYNQGGQYSVEATGFDFNEYFFGTSAPENADEAETHVNGAKLIITISRVEATDGVTWNMTELTNDPYSGVWSPVLSDGTRAQIGVFPQPNTYFTDTVAVLDYAKTTGDLAAELRQSGIKHLDADGMNFFETAATKLHDTYGNIEYANGELTYTPNTMVWNGYETFYVFGNTDDAEIIRHSANEVNENVWSKVTVIPADNVYYEDTFVSTNDGERVGIEFTGDWTLAKDDGSGTENPEGTGSNTETPEDDETTANGGVEGWEDSLADDTGYSDGTAAMGDNGATATFTFAGTGVDIYSRTNMETGLIMASIYEGTAATGLPLRTLVVDNFAKSGDYYMIPTLAIHTKPLRVDGKTVCDDNGQIVYTDLGYGVYTVKLTVLSVTGDADFDGTESTRSTYYLDGIRVYNPMNEKDVTFAEVRDILLTAKTFVAGSETSGVVFIDQVLEENEDGDYVEVSGNSTAAIGVYDAIGPENEVYLASGQMIAFKPTSGEPCFVGLKSPTGKDVTVTITDANGGSEQMTISHTTDLFYPIDAGEDGIVTISNTSGALLSVTKIKAAVTTEGQALINAIGHDEALVAAEEAYAAAAVLSKNSEAVKNPEDIDSILELRPSDVVLDLINRIFDGLRDWFV